MLLLCYRAAAFVVSDFRGPRPMSMCIQLQAAPWRLKYWRIKAEVTISTFLYLQEFFTGAAILSERFRTLQICNVLDYIDDITARYTCNVNLKNRTEKNMPHCYEIYYIDGGGISYLKKL